MHSASEAIGEGSSGGSNEGFTGPSIEPLTVSFTIWHWLLWAIKGLLGLVDQVHFSEGSSERSSGGSGEG